MDDSDDSDDDDDVVVNDDDDDADALADASKGGGRAAGRAGTGAPLPRGAVKTGSEGPAASLPLLETVFQPPALNSNNAALQPTGATLETQPSTAMAASSASLTANRRTEASKEYSELEKLYPGCSSGARPPSAPVSGANSAPNVQAGTPTRRAKMGGRFQIDFNPTVLHDPTLGSNRNSGNGEDDDDDASDPEGDGDSDGEESGADSGDEHVDVPAQIFAAVQPRPTAAQLRRGPAIELSQLPVELLWQVIACLPLFELVRTRELSRTFKKAADVVLGQPATWSLVESYAIGADPTNYIISAVCSRAANIFLRALESRKEGGNGPSIITNLDTNGHIYRSNQPPSPAVFADAADKDASSSNGLADAEPSDAEAVLAGSKRGAEQCCVLQDRDLVAHLPRTVVDVTEGGRDIDDATLVAAAMLGATLQELVLDGCSWVTDAGLLAVAAACPELRVLSMKRCHNLTDYGLAKVAEGCTSLSTLALSHNFDVTDHGLRSIAKGCPRITTLTLKNLPRITPSGFTVSVSVRKRPTFDADAAIAVQLQAEMDGVSRAVLEDMQRDRARAEEESSIVKVDTFAFDELQCLDIVSCDNMDDGLAEVLLCGPGQIPGAPTKIAGRRPCETLSRLSIEGCCSITDQFFTSIAPHSAALVQLLVAKCYLLTDATIAALTIAAPAGLEQIDVSFCPVITGAGVLRLASACPSLRQVCVVDCSGVSRVDQRALEQTGVQCYRSTFGAL